MTRNLEDGSAAGSESPSRNGQKDARSAASKLCPSSGVERSTRRIPCSGSAKCQKPSGSSATTQASERVNGHGDSAASVQSQQEGRVPPAPAPSLTANGDKVTVQVIEWPRICISLSRKEKEDDFLAMKGTKIPQRPKKRAKNVDRTLQVLLERFPIIHQKRKQNKKIIYNCLISLLLSIVGLSNLVSYDNFIIIGLQYCFPGMWLSDLTRSRYEVREKKSVKKVTLSFPFLLPFSLDMFSSVSLSLKSILARRSTHRSFST